jgi:hypothetical protein
MDWEQAIFEIVQLLLPALLAIGAAALVFRQMLNREAVKEQYRMRLEALNHVLPLKVAAYERATLLLERIQPHELMARCEPKDKSAQGLKQLMMEEMNREYQHNTVQQLYITPQSWDALKQAMREVSRRCGETLEELPPRASGPQFAETLLQSLENQPLEALPQAQRMLKRDMQRYLV